MRARHSERGTTIVETALVMGVLLLVLFGIMDFGRLMYSWHLVDNAARLGARFAIVRGSNCAHSGSGTDPWPCPASRSDAVTEIQNYVSQQSVTMGLGPLPTSQITPLWTFVQGCAPPGGVGATTYNNQPGCQVTVTVTYNYNFILPFLSGTTIPLTSTSEMLISQ